MILLLYGSKGWIGGLFGKFLDEQKIFYIEGTARCNNPNDIAEEIEKTGATHVFCAIGRTSGTGYNNIDYLEQKGKLVENIRDNLTAPLIMAQICREKNVYLSMLGTGCIYENNESTKNKIFTEKDDANFFGSSYSIVKGQTDFLIKHLFPEVLYLRIRMPISKDKNKKSFLSKIISYPKIYSTLNSVTVLEDAFAATLDMIKQKKQGLVNLVEPNPITHKEILDMYQNICDADHHCVYVNEEEHDQLLIAKRSKNVLDTSLLKSMVSSEIWQTHYSLNSRDKIEKIFQEWKNNQ